jgi:hypothetical protein
MTPYFRPACLALALLATAAPASAQTWVYEPDAPGARVYEPPLYGARAYEPAVAGQSLVLTPAQRTTIYRTIIPQGRGRGPIVRERIVTETVAPAPVLREQVVTQPGYAYPDRGYAYPEQVVTQPGYAYPDQGYAYADRVVTQPAYASAVGSRVTDAYAWAPMPRRVVNTVPAVRSYRYMVVNNRLLLVDPMTGRVVAEVTE